VLVLRPVISHIRFQKTWPKQAVDYPRSIRLRKRWRLEKLVSSGIADVHSQGNALLPQIVAADDVVGCLLRTAQSRQKQRCQHRNNCNDDQELDQSESPSWQDGRPLRSAPL